MAAALAVLIVPARSRPAGGSCTVVSASPVVFGAYDPASHGPSDSVGTITLRCQSATVVTIELGPPGSGRLRRLRSGTAFLEYGLYLDATRTVPWGDGTSGTGRFGPAAVPAGSDLTIPVYGRMPPRQRAPAGSYSDVVTVTVSF